MPEVALETAPGGTSPLEHGAAGLMSDTVPTTMYSQDSVDNQASYRVPFPIAIVGMAMKLPGGVNSAESFWEMLINKKDGHCEVPKTRYNIDAFYNPSDHNSVKSRHGYFLQDNLAHYDRSFFGATETEAGKPDPQQRLLAEVVMECMESGGQRNWRGRNIGCFIGVFGEDWLEMSTKDSQVIDRLHAMSTGDFALANRLSYIYDLQGPR
jgi:acyl transferase domain-containing protein